MITISLDFFIVSLLSHQSMFKVLVIKDNPALRSLPGYHLLFIIRVLGFKECNKPILSHNSLEATDGRDSRSIVVQDVPLE
jgi:hypothetical protein